MYLSLKFRELYFRKAQAIQYILDVIQIDQNMYRKIIEIKIMKNYYEVTTSSKSEIIVDVNYSYPVFHCQQLYFRDTNNNSLR